MSTEEVQLDIILRVRKADYSFTTLAQRQLSVSGDLEVFGALSIGQMCQVLALKVLAEATATATEKGNDV